MSSDTSVSALATCLGAPNRIERAALWHISNASEIEDGQHHEPFWGGRAAIAVCLCLGSSVLVFLLDRFGVSRGLPLWPRRHPRVRAASRLGASSCAFGRQDGGGVLTSGGGQLAAVRTGPMRAISVLFFAGEVSEAMARSVIPLAVLPEGVLDPQLWRVGRALADRHQPFGDSGCWVASCGLGSGCWVRLVAEHLMAASFGSWSQRWTARLDARSCGLPVQDPAALGKFIVGKPVGSARDAGDYCAWAGIR